MGRKRKKGIVCEKGINDMPKNWTIDNRWNKKIYALWQNKLRSVYNEDFHDKEPTYINATMCIEWHWLSKFVEDVVKIDGYNYEKFMNGELELDKDIKSNEQNKEYSLENCLFVSKLENIKQAVLTRNNDYLKGNNWNCDRKMNEEVKNKISKTLKSKNLKGENSPCSIKIAQYDKSNNLIKVFGSIREAERETGIYRQNIANCCKYYDDKELFIKTHRDKVKSAGGFIWKYYKNGDEK